MKKNSYLLGLYGNTSICYQSLDADGIIIDVNNKWLETFGYNKNDIVGSWFGDLLRSDSRDIFKQNFSLFKSKGIAQEVMFDIRCYDGSYISTIINGNMSYDYFHGAVQYHCIIEPKVSNQPTYSHIFNVSRVPMIVFEAETKNIVDANPAACHFYGYSYDDFTSKCIFDINIDPEEMVQGHIDSILREERSTYLFMHRTASGHVKLVESNPSALQIGTKMYVHSIIVDVTDKVRAQDGQKALSILSEKLIQARIDIKEISSIVLDFALLLTESDDGYVGSIDEDSKNMRIHATSKMYEQSIGNEPVEEIARSSKGIYEGLCGHSLSTLKPLICNTPQEIDCLARSRDKKMLAKNHLSFPVMLNGELAGQIAVINSKDSFSDKDVEILSEIANLYALAIKGVKEREKDILLDELINNMADCVAIYIPYGDEDFIFKSLNRSGLNVSGFELADVKGKRLTHVYPGFENSPLVEIFKEVWKTGKPQHYPLTQYIDDQHSLYVENYIFKIHERYLVAIYRDITDIVNTTKALALSEEKYRSYMENSPDSIIVINKDKMIIDINSAACDKFEYSRSEFLKMNIKDIVPEKCKGLVDENVKQAHDNSEIVATHPHISKSGRIYQMEVYVKYLPDGNMIGILHDTTHRIEMENELSELNAGLQARVKSELEIREKQDRVLFEQKKLADMGQMISAIAHQWRQPINALGLYIQSLVSDFESDTVTKSDIADFRDDTLGLIKHMSQTIDDFRNFFKPDKNKTEFNIMKEISSVIKLIDAQLAMKNIKIKLSCECRECEMCADFMDDEFCESGYTKIYAYLGEFKQALVNIIYNSVDSIGDQMSDGKIQTGMIDIKLKAEEDNICLYIYDNGTGIPDNILSKIFDPYYTTKPEGKGTGIGLYMTKLVIEEHMKGKILASNTSEGACIVIQLPS
ncbi:MAG: hypothetical protein C0603_04315 [Denitrovibrio sp.]|nr:MAG: hypothetical protein C0603_04315 [Denitrovibrio sp.]